MSDCQRSALQIESILTAISSCAGDPHRTEITFGLIEAAIEIAAELNAALDDTGSQEF